MVTEMNDESANEALLRPVRSGGLTPGSWTRGVITQRLAA